MSSLNFNNNNGCGFSLDLNVSLETENFENTNYSARGRWTTSEDNKLRKLIKYFGAHNWNHIAEHFHGRSEKSCRSRWINKLDPKINRSKFTEEEEVKLLAAQRLFGNKWAYICKEFPGRTNNQIMNHFHLMMARMQRQQSSSFSRKRNSIFRTPLTNNVTVESITSTIDVLNSTCTNVSRFTRPLLNCQAYGSQMGLHGERMVEVGSFGNETNFSAIKGPYVGHAGKQIVNKSNYSYSNSEASISESDAIIKTNVSIFGEYENVRGKTKVPYFDFLGIGDK